MAATMEMIMVIPAMMANARNTVDVELIFDDYDC
jgi:hypothetical protein